MAAPKLKLTYFDGPGRGEAIRLAFVVGDVEFEDVRLSGPQFSEQKAAGRFKNGVVPVLEIDGVQYAQSLALLLYAGKLAEIYPTDPTAALAVDEVLLSCDDIQTIVFGVVYQRDKATKEAAAKAAIAGPLTAWLNRFDAALAKNSSGYFVGDSITIADLKALVLFSYLDAAHFPGVGHDFLAAWPHINKNVKLVYSHPKIAEYYKRKNAKHIPKLKLTYFDIAGRGEPIRQALHIGAIPFEDERVSFKDWASLKASGRFKHAALPQLEIDGVPHAQSNALLLYAGELAGHGLVPSTPRDQLRVQELLNDIEDVISLVSSVTSKIPDKEQALAAQKALFATGSISKWMSRFEASLAKNGTGFFVGGDLTVADLKFASFVNWVADIEGFGLNHLDPYTAVNEFRFKFAALPEIVAFENAKSKK
eukprot:m.193145 g.193145  ORF g.193145 m.193145 type:complete len:422 (-) comp53680_c0_seq2:186-1451(-)